MSTLTRTPVLIAALSVAAPAAAAPGDHIGTEAAQLIPAIELGAFHRTNVYLQEGEAGGGAPVSGGTAIYIAPSLGIRAKNSDLIFSFDFLYQAKKYLQSSVTNLDRYNDFGFGAGLKLFPEGAVGLRIRDNFSVAGYEAEDENNISDSAYQTHLKNELGAFVAIHPGGPLEVDAGGKLAVDRWNTPEEFQGGSVVDDGDVDVSSNLSGPGLNSRVGYGPSLEARWRFFPKTAFVGTFDYEWFNWADNVLDAQGDGVSREEVGDFLAIPDGKIWRAKAGLRGRVTPKLVTGAMVGFGQALYSEDSVTEAAANLGIEGSTELADSTGYGVDLRSFPNGLLAELEAQYEFLPDQAFTASYKRDFQDVFFTNYVGFDRGVLGYQGMFAERLGLGVSGTYRYERYLGEVSRDDHFIKAAFESSYKIQEYLTASAGVNWNRRASADGNHPEIEYDDSKFRLGVKFVY